MANVFLPAWVSFNDLQMLTPIFLIVLIGLGIYTALKIRKAK